MAAGDCAGTIHPLKAKAGACCLSKVILHWRSWLSNSTLSHLSQFTTWLEGGDADVLGAGSIPARTVRSSCWGSLLSTASPRRLWRSQSAIGRSLSFIPESTC